jgi:hypothetical protein
MQRPWIWNGQKLKDGSKIYIDSVGSRWAGRRCPDCERARVSLAIKHDDFERKQIANQLANKGIDVTSHRLPMTAIVDGKAVHIGVVRAFIDDGQITIDPNFQDEADMYALIIQSVKVCSRDQLNFFKRTTDFKNVRSYPEQQGLSPDNPA